MEIILNAEELQRVLPIAVDGMGLSARTISIWLNAYQEKIPTASNVIASPSSKGRVGEDGAICTLW